jgi:aromatic ring-opening dioxygenase catalytic subunit (LigB family)
MALDPNRGFDHGVFVPLKVVFPAADVPVVEMSVDRTLDPARHLSAGRALSALRDQGIAIIASGMSFHNLQGFGDPGFTAPSEAFDAWLGETLSLEPSQRNARLEQWEAAPAARLSHPRAEHLLPLMVASGAATGAGRRVYSEHVLGVAIAGFRFD